MRIFAAKTILSTKVSITGIASVSPLGFRRSQIWNNYLSTNHHFTAFNADSLAAFLDVSSEETVTELRQNHHYKSVDRSVLYAVAASRLAVNDAGWEATTNFGINIGSSRGATALFEKHHKEFIATGKANTLSSPTTTLGNISSWVAHDLQSAGPEISHSITCSTALHALLNGVAWIRAGMSDKFLVGGSEAPLTEFTIAQMKALKIYSRDHGEFPSRALDLMKKQNSMILGEGAAVCCLEAGVTDKSLAVISGIGYATELLEHSISISAEADCFQKSMKMALADTDPSDVDVIVLHAPGTIKGDSSEYHAIEKVFKDKLPMLTTNKWKIGHTFGASGTLSIQMAILMMQNQMFIGVPFVNETKSTTIRNILVNSVGFGGNAVSILLSAPK
jgi:3-oxoacyl-(acyl-carrier-protein) synthase